MYEPGQKIVIHWRKMINLVTNPAFVRSMRNKPDEERATVTAFIPAKTTIPKTLVPSHFTEEHYEKYKDFGSNWDRVAFITENNRPIVLGAVYFNFLSPE